MSMTPIIIIGAPRSGTNMLRDAITRLPNCATWPCDEINYIWRHGNKNHPTDELPVGFASDRSRKYIQNKFQWVANTYGCEFVVEKTCANSLRVAYLYKLLPQAKFVFIYRNGLDVVGSAMKRWRAPVEAGYLVKKARFVPLTDLPTYAFKYMFNRLRRLVSKEQRLAVWGPKFDGMEKFVNSPLDELCAMQWKACVDASEQASKLIPPSQKTVICYEQFVNHPEKELTRIVEHLGIGGTEPQINYAVDFVSSKSVNKGMDSLTEEQLVRLQKLLGESLKHHGY